MIYINKGEASNSRARSAMRLSSSTDFIVSTGEAKLKMFCMFYKS